jgi:hypothetical protein
MQKPQKALFFGFFFFFEGEVITGLISYFNYRLYTMIVISAKNLNFVRFYLVLPQMENISLLKKGAKNNVVEFLLLSASLVFSKKLSREGVFCWCYSYIFIQDVP